ncbi:MAG: signal recognition particle protein [Alphaproteobacteria bacterium]|nr:signal recognition particle protein [Rhodospirillales bacterium]MCW9045866.1 signal recognition particle protein [Alphaproteobacteria bacterium]
MFDNLSTRLGGIFDKLTKRGALSEKDVQAAMREVRVALLEADVALPVVKDFVAAVGEKAVGQNVIKSVSPGQMVIKIVQDELTALLESDDSEINLTATPPVAILMVGLQGSGKTTSSAKLGLSLKNKQKKKVLLASLDVYRPAAQQQLEILGKQAEVATLPIIMGEKPVAIAKRAMQAGRLEGYDVVILDTAGRLHIDMELMAEVAAIRDVAKPTETLLVTDAMTGQDAVTVAKEFNEKVGVTGIVLTRIDGDARGGAALSMKTITGCPIKFMGSGEKIDALEPFHADRIASRILGMGDVVSLVEKAGETMEAEEAEALAKKVMKGQFNFEDMLGQLRQIKKMGDMNGLLGMLPGMGKMKKQISEANIDDKTIGHQEAIILSMTIKERQNPNLIKASRRKRIAAGSGTTVQEVNKILKQHKQMSAVMKKVGKMGKKSFMRSGGMPPGMMPGGGLPFK